MKVLIRSGYLECGKKSLNTKKPYILPCFMLLIGGGMPGKGFAMASIDDTIKPYANFGMLYDNNFLRVSNNALAASSAGINDKSEFIKQLSAGFDMDWLISRQHIVVKANVNQNWFQNFTNLDYVGWNAQAQWNWQLGNDLNGEIGYSNSQTLGGFDFINSLANNLQNNQSYFANAGYLFHPNGKIKLGLFRTELQYDALNRQINNNTEDNAQFDLQYLSPLGGIFGVRLIATSGQYPNRALNAAANQDNDYTRMNYAATWDWHATTKTRLEGSLGYTQQNYAHLSNIDFNGLTARLNLEWQATDKTLLSLSARREINQYASLTSSFLLAEGVWFNLNWKCTPKISLSLPMSYQQQQFLGSSATQNQQQQVDDVKTIGLNLTYKPVENINIGLLLKSENRSSNNAQRNYDDQSAAVNIQAVF